MGTSPSRRMEESDSRSPRSEDGSDQESDLSNILQYLIRSGQVHIISSDRDDSDDDFVEAAAPPRVEISPNTKALENSEFCLMTKQSCGELYPANQRRPASIIDMIKNREKGMCMKNGSFSRAERCRIISHHLPYKLRTIAQYHNKVFCGVYSLDGNQFLTASQDRYLRLYSTSNSQFKLFHSIQARDVGWSILDTAFSPDSSCIAYSSWSGCITLCRFLDDPSETLQEPLPLCPEDRRFCIFSVVFSSDGRELLGGANDGHLYVYDRQANQRSLRIESHNDDVNTVAFADNTSQILYSGGDDGLCKVWDRRTLSESNPTPVGVLAGHMDGVTFIDGRGDGRHLISNSKDQSIKLWDLRRFSGSEAQAQTRHAVENQNWDYRWQKVPRKLSNVKTNLDGDTSIMTYRGHSVLQTLIRARFSPAVTTGQRYIYTGCASGRVVIYDALTGNIVRLLGPHQACVRDVSWHPYRMELCSTSWDYTVMCWSHHGVEVKDWIYTDRNMVAELDFDTGRLTTGQLRRSARIAQQRRQEPARR